MTADQSDHPDSPLANRESVRVDEIDGIFQNVLNHLPTRIWWKDLDGEYLGSNAAFAQDAGFSDASELIGKCDFDLCWDRVEAETFRADDEDVLLTGVAKVNFEERRTKADGSAIWLRASKFPLYDSNDQLIGTLGTYEDITVRKKAEIALVQAKEKAERASRMKGDFLATMSHEIRTPLDVILGFLQVLRNGNNDADPREAYAAMAASGEHLSEIIEDILDLSKVETGSISLRPVSFCPKNLVEHQFARLRSKAEEKGLSYRLQTGENLPSSVFSDPARWGQIVRNLISNAIKFTDSGEIIVRLQSEARDDNSGKQKVILSVCDTGIGLSEDETQTIFSAFSGKNTSVRREHTGIGLGLFLTRKLSHLLGGDVNVRSQVGEGSEFVVAIDFDTPAVEDVSSDQGRRMTSDGAPRLGDTFPMKVLVVDDGEANRNMVSALLSQLGYKCELCEDAFEAWDKLDEETFDLIFMDLEMPGRSGLELAAMIREKGIKNTSGSDSVGIVAMTARAFPQDRDDCLRAGMDGHLAKPLRLGALRRTIQMACDAGLPA